MGVGGRVVRPSEALDCVRPDARACLWWFLKSIIRTLVGFFFGKGLQKGCATVLLCVLR